MSRVESSGQKAAPKIYYTYIYQYISPPAEVSKQKGMTKTLWPFLNMCATSEEP